MRLNRLVLVALLFCAAAPLRAEYFVLRSGQRLSVTSYERHGDAYRLQVAGGSIEVSSGDVVAIEPEEVFTAAPPPPAAKAPYRELIEAAAARHGMDADLVASVIAVESNFNSRAISRRNARGLMQLLPETAERFGVKRVFDPGENIEGGTRYLRELLDRYNNDMILALAAYNAGPERVVRFGRVPPYAETLSYVRRVKRTYDGKKIRRAAQLRADRVASGETTRRGAPL